MSVWLAVFPYAVRYNKIAYVDTLISDFATSLQVLILNTIPSRWQAVHPFDGPSSGYDVSDWESENKLIDSLPPAPWDESQLQFQVVGVW